MTLDNSSGVDHNPNIVVATPLSNPVANVPKGDSFAFMDFFTSQQHLELLKNRGLAVKNIYEEESFLRLLRSVGYYRLSQYFKHYYEPEQAKAFISGTRSSQIIASYKQNERLRILLIDALLKIEGKLRVLLTECVIQYKEEDSYWCYEPAFEALDLVGRAGKTRFRSGKEYYTEQSTRLFFEQYPKHTKIPSWVVLQSQDFGTLCQLLQVKYLPKNVLETILQEFNIPKGYSHKELFRIFDALRHLRNLCVHHEKLLGEHLRIAPPLWKPLPENLSNRLPNDLKWIEHLLLSITPRDSFRNELQEIVKIVNRDSPSGMHLLSLFSEDELSLF